MPRLQVVILAAGYGTRLKKDLEADSSGQWEHIKNCPKPLLPLGDKPLLSRWMSKLATLKGIENILVVTNDNCYEHFVNWKTKIVGEMEELKRKLIIYNDFTSSNEERLGSVADLELSVKVLQANADNILVIAGDTLFKDDFCLDLFVKAFEAFQRKDERSSLIVHTHCPEEVMHKHGIVVLDEATNRVVDFLEKPDPSDTDSRLQCPCFYLLSSVSCC